MNFVEARVWLIQLLQDGPRVKSEVLAAAKSAGLSEPMLYRVRQFLKLVDLRSGYQGQGLWTLPSDVRQGVLCEARASELLVDLRKRPGVVELSLEECVSWVSERLLDSMLTLKAENVPCGRALSLLVWAKAHQDDFRRLYEVKLLKADAAVQKTDAGKRRNRAVGGGQREAIDRLLGKSDPGLRLRVGES
jgi:hypothetical protein